MKSNALDHLCQGLFAYKIVTMCEFALERLSESAERQARHNLRSGDDVKTVQENLGHVTAAFTLDVYGHISEK